MSDYQTISYQARFPTWVLKILSRNVCEPRDLRHPLAVSNGKRSKTKLNSYQETVKEVLADQSQMGERYSEDRG